MRRIFEILGCIGLAIVAAIATFYCIQQWPTATARADFDALPEFHYLAAADELRGEQRFAEAAMVARAGIANAADDALPQLQAELTQIGIERNRDGRDGSNEFSPYGHIHDAQTQRRAEALAQKTGGIFALWIGQDAAASWLHNPDPSTDDWLLQAARKGHAGVDLLVEQGPVMLRPHPLMAVLARWYGGRVPDALRGVLEQANEALTGFAAGALLYLLLAMFLAFGGMRRAPDAKSRLVRISAAGS